MEIAFYELFSIWVVHAYQRIQETSLSIDATYHLDPNTSQLVEIT